MSLKGMNYDFLEIENERDFNLLYIQINPTVKTGFTKSKKETKPDTVSNLAIYQIDNDKLSYFFEEGSINNIKYYFYEASYNEKLERIDFNRDDYLLFNNKKIEKRELADKLFLVNERETSNELELWISSKSGSNKKMVKKFSKKIEWRIDVYNKKLLFIHKKENGINIETLNW